MTGITVTRWGKALVLSTGFLCAGLVTPPVEAEDDRQAIPNITCTDQLADSTPNDAQQWLIHSMYASHCYTFQARAVSIDALGVRTLAISHRIQDGVRQQVVQHLDGPSVSVERRSPVGRLSWVEARDGDAPSAPEAWAQQIAANYDISLDEETRVAGRTAIQLSFTPHDSQRYQHTWWIDEATGLLVKHVLSDSQGRVLETFQMTQLHSPEPYDGTISSVRLADAADIAWQVTWLPDGFINQPIDPTASELEQRFFSDGLAAVSIFATPVTENGLEPGVHQIGVSTVAVALQTLNEQRWQVIGIGELPSSQLLRIVQSVEFE